MSPGNCFHLMVYSFFVHAPRVSFLDSLMHYYDIFISPVEVFMTQNLLLAFPSILPHIENNKNEHVLLAKKRRPQNPNFAITLTRTWHYRYFIMVDVLRNRCNMRLDNHDTKIVFKQSNATRLEIPRTLLFSCEVFEHSREFNKNVVQKTFLLSNS